MKRDIARFNTSDYPADNAYDVPLANKKVPGLMKDENNGAIMIELVSERRYAIRMDDKKKAKGAFFYEYRRNANDNIQRLHAVFERKDRNDSPSIMYRCRSIL